MWDPLRGAPHLPPTHKTTPIQESTIAVWCTPAVRTARTFQREVDTLPAPVQLACGSPRSNTTIITAILVSEENVVITHKWFGVTRSDSVAVGFSALTDGGTWFAITILQAIISINALTRYILVGVHTYVHVHAGEELIYMHAR